MYSDYQRLMDVWRARLLEARKKYDVAVREAKIAGTDFTSGTLPTPDGSANTVKALGEENRALNEYMHILKIFTDLVVSGKRPEE